MLKRWRAYLDKMEEDPIWTIWRKLAAIPEKDFAAKVPAVWAGLDLNKVHPLVAQAFPTAPASVFEAAENYAKLLAAYDKAEPMKGANEEGLRQVLRRADSPTNFPFSDYDSVRLSTDKQNEDGKRASLEKLLLTQAYRGAPPRAQALEDTPERKPGSVFLRGKPENKGERVYPQFLLVLAGEDRRRFTNGSGRLELAQAIADKDNPLTARVLVNRVWLRHFGNGLVRTPSDFGARGEAPTHPELLDYLARYFVESGWSIKKLHRLIMLSRAYQQSSQDNPVARRLDPENKLLWRMTRRRLDFEELRDSLLADGGKLDQTEGGLPVSAIAWPYSYRRTVYSFIDRAQVPNDFRIFDFASPDTHSPQRYLTTVPQQALMMMNSPLVIEQARALISRPEIAGAKNPRLRVTRLYRLLYGRSPNGGEIDQGLKYLNDPANAENTSNAPEAHKAGAWQYGQGEYDEKEQRVSSFKPFDWYLNGEWRNTPMPGDPRSPIAILNSKGGLTYEGKKNALVRRWVAPFAGRVSLDGALEQSFENGCRKCEGVQATIVASGSGKLGGWTAGQKMTVTKVAEIAIQRGDTINFVVDASKGGAGNGFTWTVTVKRLDGGSQVWESESDFRNPTVFELNSWERYAQVFMAAAEFMIID
jgi:hypothetical protein